MQGQRPIAFHNQASLHLSTYEKEFLALITDVKRWRPYLLGKPCIIKTDHQSLKFLLDQKIGTPAQQKWISKLLGYAFVVEYKKGQDNKVANALSRLGCSFEEVANPNAHLFLISFPIITWIEELQQSYLYDEVSQQLLSTLKQGTTSKHYTLHNGQILYKGRIFLGPSYYLKLKVLSHVHDSPLGGHSRYLKSFNRLKQDFWWQGMKSDLKNYIKECAVCQ